MKRWWLDPVEFEKNQSPTLVKMIEVLDRKRQEAAQIVTFEATRHMTDTHQVERRVMCFVAIHFSFPMPAPGHSFTVFL
jgi:hypothetical protein